MEKISSISPTLQDIAIKDKIDIPKTIRRFQDRNELMKGNNLNKKSKEELQNIYLELNNLEMLIKV